MAEQRELTFGEKAVGILHGTEENHKLQSFKRDYANLIDELDIERNRTANSEVKRQLSLAITELQTSQMWATRAITWQF